MLDPGGAPLGQGHADHVDADPARRRAAVVGEPALGQPPQPFGLACGDRGHRMLAAALRPRFDLAHDHGVTVGRHDVDLAVALAVPAAPVALQHGHPGCRQGSRRHFLAVPSDRSSGVHVTPPPSLTVTEVAPER